MMPTRARSPQDGPPDILPALMRQEANTMATVTVRYVVRVYATVDLDTGEVVDVKQVDDGIALDYVTPEPEGGALVNTVADDTRLLEVVEPEIDGGTGDLVITPTIAVAAIDIAETADWPAWERV